MRPPRPGLRDAGGEVREVERVPALDAAFPAGQGEQRVDEALGPGAERQDVLAGFPQGCRVGLRIVECHLQQGSFDRERGAQFMGGVGHEVPLRPEQQSSLANSSFSVSPSLPNSSSRRPVRSRLLRLLAEMSCAVAVISRTGRRSRPASSHPSATDSSTSTARTTAITPSGPLISGCLTVRGTSGLLDIAVRPP